MHTDSTKTQLHVRKLGIDFSKMASDDGTSQVPAYFRGLHPYEFYHIHKAHVHRLVRGCTVDGYWPSDQDFYVVEQWRAPHWKMWLDHHGYEVPEDDKTFFATVRDFFYCNFGERWSV